MTETVDLIVRTVFALGLSCGFAWMVYQTMNPPLTEETRKKLLHDLVEEMTPYLYITAEDTLGRKVAIYGKVTEREHLLQEIERFINGDDGQDVSKVTLSWRIVKEEAIDRPLQKARS